MNLSGKNIMVTGSNTGIGRATAQDLARRGAHLILACRSGEKTAPVVDAIRAAGGTAEHLALDLGDLAAVRASAATFLATGRPLHQLINNAGLAGSRGLTKDGFELVFGVNHLGPYLFTRLLLPALEKTDRPRVINVSSQSHYRAKGFDWEALRKPTITRTALPEYSVSKLANVLFTRELIRRHPTVESCSLHPGVVGSDVWRGVPWGLRHFMKLFMLTNEQGAQTTIHCATTDDLKNGAYYDKSKVRVPNPLADDVKMARELWEKSAEWVGLPV